MESPDTLRTRAEAVSSLDSARKLQLQKLVARLTP
jgi:hypothetical protein